LCVPPPILCRGQRSRKAALANAGGALLSIDYLSGFAVRLHMLGDSYSGEYVEICAKPERHPALNGCGYSARQTKTIQLPRSLRSRNVTRTDS
jgi:hypothetical protein